MSAVTNNENDDEREKCFSGFCMRKLNRSSSGSVMYVENDHLMSKRRIEPSIVIKRLEGRILTLLDALLVWNFKLKRKVPD
jgi:hypothetical protein